MQSTLSRPQVTGQQKTRLPDFMIIGAAKSGTTSLAHYLMQHPEVFFSAFKEPNYFALVGEKLPQAGPAPANVLFELLHRHSVTDYQRYLALFRNAGDRVAGEASVRYLYYREAPGRIKGKVPDIRLVAILRDPVERLYSHYCMNVQNQLEPLALPDALAAEDDRVEGGWGWDWHYRRLGHYSEQLQRYLDLFPTSQLKVLLYEDFVANPAQVFEDICRHIGVDPGFRPDMSQRQKSAYRPRSRALDRWLHWPSSSRMALKATLPAPIFNRGIAGLRRFNSGPVPKLDPSLKRSLRTLFQEDGEKLAQMLHRRIAWAGEGS